MPLVGRRIGALDGLRALAVSLVVLFHSGLQVFSQGYVGVDVFFVISGFLITGIICDGIERQSFTFSQFYVRRILRLIPALLVVLLATGVISRIIFSADAANAVSESGIFATLSLSNIYFWNTIDYFNQNTELMPILHTWSLAVEEQFYLIWPLAIFLITRLSREFLIYAMVATVLVSLSAALLMYDSAPTAVFYLTPFRVFQFAAGGLLYLYGDAAINKSGTSTVTGVVLFLIVMFAEPFGGHVFFNMGLPTLAAMAIIAGRGSLLSTIFLDGKILKWIGDRSYSIYLVHWPIIVFYSYLTDASTDAPDFIFYLALSVFLGALVHSLVETPFRIHGKTSKRRIVLSAAATALLLLSTLTVFGFSKITSLGGNPLGDHASSSSASTEMTSDPVSDPVETGRRGGAEAQPVGSTCYMMAANVPTDWSPTGCTFNSDSDQRVLIYGDSLAEINAPIRQAYPDVAFAYFVVPGCDPRTPALVSGDRRRHCDDHFAYFYTTVIPEFAPTTVMFISNYLTRPLQDVVDTAEYLSGQGMSVIVVGLAPQFRIAVPEIVSGASDADAAARRADELLEASVFEVNANLRAILPDGIKFLDLANVVCEDRSCPILTNDGSTIYRDRVHFTREGLLWLGQRLQTRVPGLLSEPPQELGVNGP